MKILVINAGSSSLKYQLIDMETEHLLAKGLCERIGIDGKFTYKPQLEGKEAIKAAVKDYYDKNGIAYDKSKFPACEDCESCRMV